MPVCPRIWSEADCLIIDMDQFSFEKRRASNMVWNAAEDYSFHPEVLAYDEQGGADLYLNSVVGILHKSYDWEKLSGLLEDLKEEGGEDCAALLWLGLEHCAYERERGARPVLEELRREYAEKRLARARDWRDQGAAERIETAHFQRALGREPKLPEREQALLNGIEFDPGLNTDQLTARAREVLSAYYQLLGKKRGPGETRLYLPVIFSKGADAYLGPLHETRDLGFGSAKDRRGAPDSRQRKQSWLMKRRRKNQEKLRGYMEGSFGTSICGEERLRELEQKLCTGNHAGCHLHFTRGEFGPNRTEKSREVLAQQRKNEEYYQDRRIQFENSILSMTERIRNALLVYHDPEIVRTNAGRLAGGRVWRGLYLEDQRIFEKIHQEDPGNLSVDILLDSSSSQLQNQEKVAAQGYMIAEALTRCGLPVRVYAFCSVNTYTVVKLFRDYEERNQNQNIFRYFSAGWNRDGLAVRTARLMLEDSPCEHRLLILLSDVNPNDDGKFPSDNPLLRGRDYGGKAGVEDTAQEVRRTRRDGVSVLCVFTGKDEEVENAKTIYGQEFVRIKSVDHFADAVGGLLQRQIREMA